MALCVKEITTGLLIRNLIHKQSVCLPAHRITQQRRITQLVINNTYSNSRSCDIEASAAPKDRPASSFANTAFESNLSSKLYSNIKTAQAGDPVTHYCCTHHRVPFLLPQFNIFAELGYKHLKNVTYLVSTRTY